MFHCAKKCNIAKKNLKNFLDWCIIFSSYFKLLQKDSAHEEKVRTHLKRVVPYLC
jgi:hypothetical protein